MVMFKRNQQYQSVGNTFFAVYVHDDYYEGSAI